MQHKKVLAAVVTYNRLELLKRCIAFIQRQTVQPDLLVINNDSTDGTEAYLAQEGIPYITQPNGGSSAGWFTGISEAQKGQYDYVWLMDDDGFPDEQALEHLVNAFTPESICVASAVVKENKRDELVFGMPVLNKNGNPVLLRKNRKREALADFNGIREYPFVHLFNGALIDVEKTRQVGNVNRDYFIYGDEVDYFCRMRKAGVVKTCLKAKHYHPDLSLRKIEQGKVYYYIRNTLILNRKYFDHVALRNFFTIGIALWRIVKKGGVSAFFSYVFGKNRRFVYYGIADGYKEKYIKRF